MIGIYCHHSCRFSRNTGIQRCLRAIARALKHQGELIAPLIWDQSTNALQLADQSALDNLSNWSGPNPNDWCMQLPPPGSWLLVVELISGPYQPSQESLLNFAAINDWRVVGIFHDSIPLSWGGEAAKYHSAYMSGLAKYDLVLATSSVTKNEIESFWQQHEVLVNSRIESLPLAAEIPGVPRRSPLKSQLRQFPNDELRLLSVGSLEPRKNHRTLLKALAWLQNQRNCNIRLQLVGWANDQRVLEMIRRAQLIGLSVYWDGYADDNALLSYYTACHLMVYPSLQEGFGLPLLESLWLGRPCLTGELPALKEQTTQGGCLIENTANWYVLATVIAELCYQPDRLNQLQHDLANCSLRSWSEYVLAMKLLMKKLT